MGVEFLKHIVDRGIQYTDKPDLLAAQVKLEGADLGVLTDQLRAALQTAESLFTAYQETHTAATSKEGPISSLHAGYTTLHSIGESSNPHAQAMLEGSARLLKEEPIQLSRLEVLQRVIGETAAALAQLVDDTERLEPLHNMAGQKAELMAQDQTIVAREGIAYLRDL